MKAYAFGAHYVLKRLSSDKVMAKFLGRYDETRPSKLWVPKSLMPSPPNARWVPKPKVAPIFKWVPKSQV